MGYQNALYKLGIPYDSDKNIEFADYSMECISYYAILSSSELAKERGTYPSYDGSLWSQGIFPKDSIDILEKNRGSEFIKVDKSETLDWDKLRTKVKKDGIEKMELNLVKNDDILKLIKDSKCIKIGFAAETSNHDEFGANKLNSKDLDMIVINDVSNAQIGFESDYNQVKIITKKGDIFKSDIENKKIIASNIVDKLKTIIN